MRRAVIGLGIAVLVLGAAGAVRAESVITQENMDAFFEAYPVYVKTAQAMSMLPSSDELASLGERMEGEDFDPASLVNQDADVDGFIVQLPLPKHISEQRVTEAIDYRKDVDGFHPVNVGRVSLGLSAFVSATPAGILELLKRYKIETAGKHVVVIGRSNIVGKPVANLLMQKAYPGNASVTVVHSYSTDIKAQCLSADIIICALGKPGFLTADMVKDGVVVIDVGTTRVPSTETKSGFRLKGDVDFDNVAPKCSFITPVPGGVGLMTRVSLMQNTLLAGSKAIYK